MDAKNGATRVRRREPSERRDCGAARVTAPPVCARTLFKARARWRSATVLERVSSNPKKPKQPIPAISSSNMSVPHGHDLLEEQTADRHRDEADDDQRLSGRRGVERLHVPGAD